MKKRLLALALALALFLGLSVPALAADDPTGPPPLLEGVLYDVGDAALRGLANGLSMLIPPAGRPPLRYKSPDFYTGTQRFIDQPEGAKRWSLGYAKKSLIPAGYFDKAGGYIGPNDVYMGGGLELLERKNPTKLLDDQAVRVTALSDGSGRGTVVFASIDGYALTSTEVRAIRALLRDFAKEKNIVSINIGTLHQHSAIDILGMNGPLINALLLNPAINLTFGLVEPYSGKNSKFMENLRQVTAAAIKEAVNGMKRGSLTYGAVDAEQYINDKRAPEKIDPMLHRFRFRPDDGSRETWLVNYAAHCVGIGAGTREVTGDYPYYMEAEVNKRANFQMIQGAQLAISVHNGMFGKESDTHGIQRVERYGRNLGRMLAGITREAAVEPILNIRHREFRVPIDNPLHLLLFRYGMIEAEGVRRYPVGPAMDLITETAYMELGRNLAVAFAPGEMDPCLAFGGGLTAQEAFTGKEFKFTPMKDNVRGSRKLLVFGIINDHSGYYLLPNDIQSFVLFGNEEINTAGTQGSEKLLEAYAAILAGLK